MKEKELRRQIREKQAELKKIEWDFIRTKYEKQVNAFCDALRNNDSILTLIMQNDMNTADCVLFAKLISNRIKPIYNTFSTQIEQNKTRREKRNEARTKRRNASMEDKTMQPEQHNAASSTPGTVTSDNNLEARQY